MAYKMFDENFKEITIEDSGDWCYLYVENYRDFLDKYEDVWVLNGINEDGFYKYEEFWEDIGGKWRKLTDKNSFTYKKISEKISSNVKGTKKGWNIIIILDTGERIKTNTEPVSIEDVQEAIGVLVKPSILGMRIKSFEIIAE